VWRAVDPRSADDQVSLVPVRGLARLKRLLSSKPKGDLADLARTTLDEPLVVVDIGALGGLLPELAPIEGHARAIGFDPDPDECDRLNQDARARGLPHRYLPFAVAGSDGPRTFRVYRKEASSSLLEPNRDYHDRFPESERMDVVKTIEVDTRALGPLLAAEHVEPEFLKLDAHGVEDEILASLDEGQWAGLLAVHAELLLAPHYVGQTGIGAVHDRLVEHGFELYSLRRYSSRRAAFDNGAVRSRGQLAFADALYLRRTRDLPPERRRRLAVVAAAFRHYDFAHELLGSDEAARAQVLSLAARPGRGPWSSDTGEDWI
jgi:FkbM family methyltransferase